MHFKCAFAIEIAMGCLLNTLVVLLLLIVASGCKDKTSNVYQIEPNSKGNYFVVLKRVDYLTTVKPDITELLAKQYPSNIIATLLVSEGNSPIEASEWGVVITWVSDTEVHLSGFKSTINPSTYRKFSVDGITVVVNPSP